MIGRQQREELAEPHEILADERRQLEQHGATLVTERFEHAADISEFVPISAVDPVYFDKAYYLGPDKGGSKAYWLFAEVLKESGRVALAK